MSNWLKLCELVNSTELREILVCNNCSESLHDPNVWGGESLEGCKLGYDISNKYNKHCPKYKQPYIRPIVQKPTAKIIKFIELHIIRELGELTCKIIKNDDEEYYSFESKNIIGYSIRNNYIESFILFIIQLIEKDILEKHIIKEIIEKVK